MEIEHLRKRLDMVDIEDNLLQSYLTEPLIREMYIDSEYKSVCSTLTLMSLFGPDRISINDGVDYQTAAGFWDTVERLGLEKGWEFYLPTSAYDFIVMMEHEDVIGAIVATNVHVNGHGDMGHVMAVLGSWEERSMERRLILHDTARLFGGLMMEMGFDEMVDLYTDSEVDDDGDRRIVVLMR